MMLETVVDWSIKDMKKLINYLWPCALFASLSLVLDPFRATIIIGMFVGAMHVTKLIRNA